MFIIDFGEKRSIDNLSLYLTAAEAEAFVKNLQSLFANPEAFEHFHIYDERGQIEGISCSLVTKNKLKNLDKYNEVERKILSNK